MFKITLLLISLSLIHAIPDPQLRIPKNLKFTFPPNTRADPPPAPKPKPKPKPSPKAPPPPVTPPPPPVVTPPPPPPPVVTPPPPPPPPPPSNIINFQLKSTAIGTCLEGSTISGSTGFSFTAGDCTSLGSKFKLDTQTGIWTDLGGQQLGFFTGENKQGSQQNLCNASGPGFVFPDCQVATFMIVGSDLVANGGTLCTDNNLLFLSDTGNCGDISDKSVPVAGAVQVLTF